MFDDLKIRNKLVLLVAGPMVLILLLAGLGAQTRSRTADSARQVTSMVDAATGISEVMDALQAEALFSAGHIASERESWVDELGAARTATDAAIEAIRPALEGDLAGSSTGVATTATMAATTMDRLGAVRSVVDEGYTWVQAVDSYRTIEESFLRLDAEIAGAVADPAVSARLRTLNALESLKQAGYEQGALMVGAAFDGGFGDEAATGAHAAYEAAVEREANQEAILASVADSEMKSRIRDARAGRATSEHQVYRTAVAEAGEDGDLQLDPQAVADATAARLSPVHAVITDQLGEQADHARSEAADARRSASLFLVGALVAVVLAGAAAIFLGRRITRPLDRLTQAADKLSKEQMPLLVESLRNPSLDEVDLRLSHLEEIEVDSGDEIGQLAEAFNNVQRVTGEVASEQAATLRKGIGDMFVNLARRNQALLDRQIEFIDELERTEENPDQLDNLYKLDHMATRMRRNAESLLVLAGAEPPRRRGRPAPFANVVRAALAEVEDFGRIELVSLDEVFIASTAASDLAHLLSELMENATNFSPPDTKVEIVGNRTKADGYVIAITDHGIGMSGEQIEESNRVLARPPHVGLALSRSLGFIVVGRLALRHGISVRMMPAPGGGVTALVTLPPALVTDAPTAPRSSRTLRPAASTRQPAAEAPKSSSVPPAVAFAPPQGPRPGADRDGAAGRPDPAPSPATVSHLGSSRRAPSGPTPTPAPSAPSAGSAPLAFEPGPRTGPKVPDAPDGAKVAPLTEGGLPSRRLVARPAPGRGSTAGDEPETAGGATSDGAVPPLAARSRTVPAPADPPPLGSAGDGPGADGGGTAFLEESGPPRLFGGGAAKAPAPKPAPAKRLFGRDDAGSPVPLPPSAEVSAPAVSPRTEEPGPAPVEPTTELTSLPEDLPEDLPVGIPAEATALRTDEVPTASADVAPVAATPAEDLAAAEPVPTGGDGGPPAALPTRTPAGLARRSPRAGGGTRAMPGSDGERGVGASKRSPEEVRNLLSRYRDGRQRARTEPIPDTGSEEDGRTWQS